MEASLTDRLQQLHSRLGEDIINKGIKVLYQNDYYHKNKTNYQRQSYAA